MHAPCNSGLPDTAVVFSTYTFLFLFLPAFLLVFSLCPSRAREAFLLFASMAFLAVGQAAFLPLYIVYIFIQWVFARSMSGQSSSRDRLFLLAGIGLSIVLWLSFRHYSFGRDGYMAAIESLGLTHLRPDLFVNILLPVGFSFLIFQSISFLIDRYRGQISEPPEFIRTASYFLFFPQFLAGPIVRFGEIRSQFDDLAFRRRNFARGGALFALGLGKKVLLANHCALVAETAWMASDLQTLDAWLGVFAFSFYIYFDFSAYMDMAMGIALCAGIVLPKNFEQPYTAINFSEFWRRWHITLMNWLRDYIVQPLGLSQSRQASGIGAGLTIILFAVWHGFTLPLLLWGLLHAMFVLSERLSSRRGFLQSTPPFFQVAVHFAIISVLWIFFQANTLGEAFQYLSFLAGWGGSSEAALFARALIRQEFMILILCSAALIVWRAPTAVKFTRRMGTSKAILVLIVLITALFFLSLQSPRPFYYFSF